MRAHSCSGRSRAWLPFDGVDVLQALMRTLVHRIGRGKLVQEHARVVVSVLAQTRQGEQELRRRHTWFEAQAVQQRSRRHTELAGEQLESAEGALDVGVVFAEARHLAEFTAHSTE